MANLTHPIPTRYPEQMYRLINFIVEDDDRFKSVADYIRHAVAEQLVRDNALVRYLVAGVEDGAEE